MGGIRTGGILALLCFFLPWAMVTCNGRPLIRMSGYSFVSGNLEFAKGSGVTAKSFKLYFDDWKRFAFPSMLASILLIVAVSFFSMRRWNCISTFVLSISTSIAAIISEIGIVNSLNDMEELTHMKNLAKQLAGRDFEWPKIRIDIITELWFYLTVICLWMVSYLSMRNLKKLKAEASKA